MITFNKEKHEYRNESGVIIPNVTRIIQDTGLTPYEYADTKRLEESAYFGNAVHLACELHDKDNLDENSLDLMIKPYLNAWVKFKKNTGFVCKRIEHLVYSQKLKYAGTIDRIGVVTGELAVVDIKSSTTIYSFVEVQTAAYMAAYNETAEKDSKVKTRFCVQLRRDGTYKLTEHKDHIRDINVFISALNIYLWKQGKGIKTNGK